MSGKARKHFGWRIHLFLENAVKYMLPELRNNCNVLVHYKLMQHV